MGLPYVDEISEKTCIRQRADDTLQEELDDHGVLGLAFLGFEHSPALVVISVVTLPEDLLHAIKTPCDWENGVLELPHDASSREVLIATFTLALTFHFEADNMD